MAISFQWKCSYQNELEYQVFGHRNVRSIEAYRVCEHGLLEYQRKIYNGDDAEFQRTMVARQGGVKIHWVDMPHVDTATYWANYRWTQELYQAFVQWLKDEHAAYLIEHERRRKKYGYTPEEYPVLEMKPIPRPIFYNPDSKTYEVEPWFTPEMASIGPAADLAVA